MELAWDPSPDPSVIGYRVYYGTVSGNYSSSLDASNSTDAVIPGLTAGLTYYFVVVAYDASGLESLPSNEVAYTVPGGAGNQAPTLDPLSNLIINEDSGLQIVNLSGITSGSSNEIQTLSVTASSSSVGLIPNPTVTYTSPNNTGMLTLAPVANAFGTATITVTVNDGGPSSNIVTRSFTVTVNPVNDPPTINSLSALTLNEDAAQQTVNLSGITSGAANESQTLTVSAASSATSLIPNPTVTYSSPNSTGSLKFTPVPNAFGTAIITVTVMDSGTSNNITTTSFTVTVNAVNDPPALDKPGNVTINEDSGPQTVNLTGISAGPTNESQTLTVSATSSNPSVIPNPAVGYSSPSTTGTLTCTPAANAYGTATITVTVSDGQSSSSQTFTVTVLSVNDLPTINPVSNFTISENSSPQTVNLSGITSGAANESQTLTVTAVSSNTALIPNPTVTYTSPNTTGSLKITPLTNTFGSTLITVTVRDNGTSNNIATTSFTVTVNQVNGPPKLDPIGNLTINEDAGLQTVNLSGITSGAVSQSPGLVVTATSSSLGLVPNPTVAYSDPSSTGTLSFSTVTNAFGTATIVVTVTEGQLSSSRAFAVVVNSVNDQPTLDPLSDMTVNSSTGQQIVNLTGISSGAANESQTLTITTATSDPSLIPQLTPTYVSPATTGTLKFTPTLNSSGTVTLTAAVRDGGLSNSVIFRSFVVTLLPGPTITTINNQVIRTNTGAGPLSFNISHPTILADNLILSAQSSNPSLIPVSNIVFGGSDTNRTVTLNPLADQTGVSTITITVSDGTMTASTTFQLSVQVPPAGPANLMVVTVSGSGSITPNLNGQILVLGKTYTMTAVPGAGQVFNGWSGKISAASAKLNFTASSNMFLQANFIPNPFTPVTGSYYGLFYENDAIRLASSGYFTVSVTSKGTYTGSLILGAGRYSIKGQFNSLYQGTNFILRKTGTPLSLSLRVGTGGEMDRIFGALSDGTWTANLQGDRAVFNAKTNIAPLAASYTLIIPGQDGDASIPAGHGCGTLNVDASGKIKFAGSLADGTKITQSSAVSKLGAWPFFVPLSKGSGSVMSWLAFENRSTDDIHGDLNWIKQTNPLAKLYPAGFTRECEALGSAYLPPALGSNILGLNTGIVTFDGGNIDTSFANVVTLGLSSKVVNNSSNALSLSFTLTSGAFKGKVTDPANNKSMSFNGVVLPKMNAGYGYALGTNQSSQVTFGP